MSRIEMVKKMLEETPGDAFLIYALALEEHKEGKLAEAILRLEELKDSQSDYLGTYYQLGKFYEEAQELSKAMDIYRKGITVARLQKADKMVRELSEALFILDDED